MPRVKILRTVGKKDTMPPSADNPNSLELPAKPDGSMYQEGEEVDLKEADAQKFYEAGMAEPVEKARAEAAKTEAYDTMTVEELHHEAGRRELAGRSELKTKDVLIDALKKDDKTKARGR